MTDAPQYLTLVAARALKCNGCGDCCDSRHTDGYWTWGALPAHQYRALFGGRPLIMPLARVDGGWADRPHTPADVDDLSRTNFRCAAFEPHEDGTGGCGIHDREVPAKCRAFPVGGEDVEADVDTFGEHWLATSAFPRCTWYRMVVVRDGDPRAERG